MRVALLVLLFSLGISAEAQEVELSLLDMLALSAYRNPSDAMEPTVHAGEIIYVNARGFQSSRDKPGDVIAYRSASPTSTLLVKRAVALSGSTVQFRRWKLLVDDKEVTEPYVNPDNVMSTSSFEWGPVTVKNDCVFVLADNRDRGHDSRTQGCVPSSEIVGIVEYVAPAATPQKARLVK